MVAREGQCTRTSIVLAASGILRKSFENHHQPWEEPPKLIAMNPLTNAVAICDKIHVPVYIKHARNLARGCYA